MVTTSNEINNAVSLTLSADRCNALADFIENVGDAFDMTSVLEVQKVGYATFREMPDAAPNAVNHRRVTECGAVGCIAGWAVTAFATQEDLAEYPNISTLALAEEILGLDEQQARELFTPDFLNGADDWRHVMPKDAAHTLRYLAETGEVDWSTVHFPDCEDCGERPKNCACALTCVDCGETLEDDFCVC